MSYGNRKVPDGLAERTLAKLYPLPSAMGHSRGHDDAPASSNHDREYTEDQLEFLIALQDYKSGKHRPFPTCCEILNVLRSLGYAKPTPAQLLVRAVGANDASPGGEIAPVGAPVETTC